MNQTFLNMMLDDILVMKNQTFGFGSLLLLGNLLVKRD